MEEQAVDLFLCYNQSILSCLNWEVEDISIEYLSLKECLGELDIVAVLNKFFKSKGRFLCPKEILNNNS